MIDENTGKEDREAKTAGPEYAVRTPNARTTRVGDPVRTPQRAHDARRGPVSLSLYDVFNAPRETPRDCTGRMSYGCIKRIARLHIPRYPVPNWTQ
jgi:hypothetical protein